MLLTARGVKIKTDLQSHVLTLDNGLRLQADPGASVGISCRSIYLGAGRSPAIRPGSFNGGASREVTGA